MMHVLAVDDDITVIRTVERLLRARGHRVTTADCGEAALAMVGAVQPDLILLDVQMPGIDGLETLTRLGQTAPTVPVIIMTGLDDVATAVRAFKAGAVDFVSKPFAEDKLLAALAAVAEAARTAPTPTPTPPRNPAVVGAAPRLREALDLALRFARPDINILLFGETGTGKELFARAIHEGSKRRRGPFVPVDCSMLAESLIEAELFGAEKGSYTGADKARVGLFERANGGTLFLDEIGNLSPGVQVKLLRVLQERTITPVGGREREIDVRIVSATNVDLIDAAKRGAFRADLYYRIAEATVSPPPLRERRGDVPALAQYFVERYASRYESQVKGVSPAALAILEAYAWPGNVRELENVIKHAVALAGEYVQPADLPPTIASGALALLVPSASPSSPAPILDAAGGAPSSLRLEVEIDSLDLKLLAKAAAEQAERALLERLMGERRYTQGQLAKLLNIDAKTLRDKLDKLRRHKDQGEGGSS